MAICLRTCFGFGFWSLRAVQSFVLVEVWINLISPKGRHDDSCMHTGFISLKAHRVQHYTDNAGKKNQSTVWLEV